MVLDVNTTTVLSQPELHSPESSMRAFRLLTLFDLCRVSLEFQWELTFQECLHVVKLTYNWGYHSTSNGSGTRTRITSCFYPPPCPPNTYCEVITRRHIHHYAQLPEAQYLQQESEDATNYFPATTSELPYGSKKVLPSGHRLFCPNVWPSCQAVLAPMLFLCTEVNSWKMAVWKVVLASHEYLYFLCQRFLYREVYLMNTGSVSIENSLPSPNLPPTICNW